MLIEGILPVYQRFISQIVVRGGFHVTHKSGDAVENVTVEWCDVSRGTLHVRPKNSWRKELDLRSPRSTRHHSLACNLRLPSRHCRRVTGVATGLPFFVITTGSHVARTSSMIFRHCALNLAAGMVLIIIMHSGLYTIDLTSPMSSNRLINETTL